MSTDTPLSGPEWKRFDAWWATQDVRPGELVYKMVAWNGWLARSAESETAPTAAAESKIADLKRQLAEERDHGARLQKQVDAILRTDQPDDKLGGPERNATLRELIAEIDRPLWRAAANARLDELEALLSAKVRTDRK